MAMAAGRVLPTSAPPKISINKLLVCGGGIAPPLLVFTILVLPAQLLPRIEEDLLYTLPVYDDFVEKSGVGAKRRHHLFRRPLDVAIGNHGRPQRKIQDNTHNKKEKQQKQLDILFAAGGFVWHRTHTPCVCVTS